jgi:hypothetical protein
MLHDNLGFNRYGPRYIFEAFPFVALSCATTWCGLIKELRERRPTWVAAIVTLGVLIFLSCLVRLPIFAERFARVAAERQDLYRQVEDRELHNAIVFVCSGMGEIRFMHRDDYYRNGVSLDQPVLYVRGLAWQEQALIRHSFPDHKFWVYSRSDGSVRGELHQIEPALVVDPNGVSSGLKTCG